MNQKSESGPKSGKRGLWKWLLAGTVPLIAFSLLAVLKSDDALLPYDDLKVVETPVPDIRTNGYLYLREKWGQWPRTGQNARVKAMANGQEPPDQAFIDRLRYGRANSAEDWRTALAMPEWRLPSPVNSEVETGSWMILPVQLLVLDAMISLRAGDGGPAIALQREMALWIKRHLAGGDGVTSVLVATAAMEMAANLGCGVLALGNPDPGQLEIMERVWGEEPLITEAWRSAVRKDGAGSGLFVRCAEGPMERRAAAVGSRHGDHLCGGGGLESRSACFPAGGPGMDRNRSKCSRPAYGIALHPLCQPAKARSCFGQPVGRTGCLRIACLFVG